jgi:hypothetical protein
MARRRKTKAERDSERAEAERLAWEQFRPRLEALQSYEDALRLVNQAPPPDSPGRRYYSNLGFFLQNFTPPMGSSSSEKSLYLKFIQKLGSAGALKPGTQQKVEEDLRRAIERQGIW